MKNTIVCSKCDANYPDPEGERLKNCQSCGYIENYEDLMPILSQHIHSFICMNPGCNFEFTKTFYGNYITQNGMPPVTCPECGKTQQNGELID